MASNFDQVVASLTDVGLRYHREAILENSRLNAPHIEKTLREVRPDHRPALIVSAGPSLYRQGILPRLQGFKGTIIATDGAYIQCLKAGIKPDWVITLDPHPTRMVRWFGDLEYEGNSKNDDYFKRQDLDVGFREDSARQNQKNIELVDENPVKLAICTTAPANVVERTAHCKRFWFAPLVDDPAQDGLTQAIVSATGVPALNTGGTVGTCAWVFASRILQSSQIAVVGMDFGYYLDTTLEQTQSWHMLNGDPEMYPRMKGHWGEAFTDPTYQWYKQNFLDLLEASDSRVTNCSEGGLLVGDRIDCMNLDEWLKSFS